MRWAVVALVWAISSIGAAPDAAAAQKAFAPENRAASCTAPCAYQLREKPKKDE